VYHFLLELLGDDADRMGEVRLEVAKIWKLFRHASTAVKTGMQNG
jgi:hypothetical protein